MTRKNWKDNKIEDYLNDIPNIADRRPKSEILARLKQDERLTPSLRKKSKKWMPALITVAALLIIGLLIPAMLPGNEVSMKDQNKLMTSENDDKSIDNGESAKNTAVEEKSEMDTAETNTLMKTDDVDIGHFAVYSEEETLFHIGLAGDQASSIPITFIIPDSQIEEDFGHLIPTSYELYKKYAALIDEEALGFQAYHPYEGDLVENSDVIVHKLPEDHSYDSAAASMEVYHNSLQDTFYGYQEVRFENNDGVAVVFAEVGESSTPLVLNSGRNHYNYYLFEQEDGQQFLSSNFSNQLTSLAEALQQMKVKPNDVFQPVIPSTIDFEVDTNTDATIIRFTRPLDLDAMEPLKAMQMVEGMLLTAASFEEQLQLEIVVQSQWNGFDFSQPLPIPVGSNPMQLILK